MNTLIILFAQTKGAAIVEILLLLMVAAIIGYITSWLYFRSIYKKRILVVESERHEFNNRIINLNAEISKLNKNNCENIQEIEQLELKVNALRELHKEAVGETDEMKLKKNKAEQLLYNKNEAIIQLIQGKHFLDYNSFGTANEAEKDDLKMISGISPLIEEQLNVLDIYTFRQISKFTYRDIEIINDSIQYFTGRIEKDEWVIQAKELLNSKEIRIQLLEEIRKRKALIHYNRIGIAKIEEADDLTIISGIGGWIKEKLNALDIYTFKQISNFTNHDVQMVTEAIEFFPGRIDRDEWIQQAGELLLKAGKKSVLLKSIEEMKDRVNFDKLGKANLQQANNLTLINGIGIWTEEKLNSLGVYTFKQISKLTQLDVETIAEVLNISTDRIDNHKWISQAAKLANRQYQGAKMFPKN